jgi:hypothetical protein
LLEAALEQGFKEGTQRNEWTPDWGIIVAKVQTRTAKQCRERFFDFIDPGINHSPLTEDDQHELTRLHALHGTKWAVIAGHMPQENGRRAGNQLKNTWNRMVNAYRRGERNSDGASEQTSDKADTTSAQQAPRQQVDALAASNDGSSQLAAAPAKPQPYQARSGRIVKPKVPWSAPEPSSAIAPSNAIGAASSDPDAISGVQKRRYHDGTGAETAAVRKKQKRGHLDGELDSPAAAAGWSAKETKRLRKIVRTEGISWTRDPTAMEDVRRRLGSRRSDNALQLKAMTFWREIEDSQIEAMLSRDLQARVGVSVDSQQCSTPVLDDDHYNTQHEVEAIVGRRYRQEIKPANYRKVSLNKSMIEYRVRWKGFSVEVSGVAATEHDLSSHLRTLLLRCSN